jgi:DNA repair and recombination protein RAD52
MQSPFDEKQLKELDKKLDERLVDIRKGGGNRKLKYIEGHSAIDQADRIFGFGNWGYVTLACEQTIIHDLLTGDPIGIAYKAKVQIDVKGCVPVVEVGSQPVATASIEDHIMGKRRKEASEKNQAIDDSPFNPFEIALARTIIMESHEQAEKGAVTDAVKRGLRTYGEQFGNGLYGDGRVEFEQEDEEALKELQQKYNAYIPIFTAEGISGIKKMKEFTSRVLKKSLEKATEAEIDAALDLLSKARLFVEVAAIRDPGYKELGILAAKAAVRNFPVDHPLDIFGHPKQEILSAHYYNILKQSDGDLSQISTEVREAHPETIKKLEIKIAS